jgi:hypothetical protein
MRFLRLSPIGGSIFITSAPKSPIIVAADGPAIKLAASIILIPSNKNLSDLFSKKTPH